MRPFFLSIFILLLLRDARSAEPQPARLMINEATQNARDQGRLLILEAELVTEQQRLQAAQSALHSSPTEESRANVHRHAENVKALLRELSRTGTSRSALKPQFAVRAARPSRDGYGKSDKSTSNFWDPYNRAPDPIDFLPSQRKETP